MIVARRVHDRRRPRDGDGPACRSGQARARAGATRLAASRTQPGSSSHGKWPAAGSPSGMRVERARRWRARPAPTASGSRRRRGRHMAPRSRSAPRRSHRCPSVISLDHSRVRLDRHPDRRHRRDVSGSAKYAGHTSRIDSRKSSAVPWPSIARSSSSRPRSRSSRGVRAAISAPNAAMPPSPTTPSGSTASAPRQPLRMPATSRRASCPPHECPMMSARSHRARRAPTPRRRPPARS